MGHVQELKRLFHAAFGANVVFCLRFTAVLALIKLMVKSDSFAATEAVYVSFEYPEQIIHFFKWFQVKKI